MEDPNVQGLRGVRRAARRGRVREEAEPANRHVNGEINKVSGQERDGRIGFYCVTGVGSGG